MATFQQIVTLILRLINSLALYLFTEDLLVNIYGSTL